MEHKLVKTILESTDLSRGHGINDIIPTVPHKDHPKLTHTKDGRILIDGIKEVPPMPDNVYIQGCEKSEDDAKRAYKGFNFRKVPNCVNIGPLKEKVIE